MSDGPPIRNVSDTALWVAVYRARENDRPDAAFRDPYARRLAGARGEEIARSMPFSEKATWAWIARTVLFDRFVSEEVAGGVDAVLNLGAGLDARPYRMPLPASLLWVEADLPGILDYKEGVLAEEKPSCALERVRIDLSDVAARRALFARVGRDRKKVLVLSEGFLIYLSEDAVGDLAEDLAAPPTFSRWVLDLASPGLLKMLRANMAAPLSEGAAALKFAPAAGTAFFEAHGWKALDVRIPLKEASRLGRLPFGLRLVSFLPSSPGPNGKRPWSGVCLYGRAAR